LSEQGEHGRQKRMTVYDIAEMAGVSISTVSRALNDSGPVSGAQKARIVEIARKANFRPHAAARSLRTKRTHMVVFGVADIGNAFFTDMIPVVQDYLGSQGYDLLVFETKGSLNNNFRNWLFGTRWHT